MKQLLLFVLLLFGVRLLIKDEIAIYSSRIADIHTVQYGIECPHSRRFQFRILVRTQLIHEPLSMHVAITRNPDVEKGIVSISAVLAYQGKQGTPDTYPVQWTGPDKPAGWLAGWQGY